MSAAAAASIRLAVLEADTLLPDSDGHISNYTGLYTALLAAPSEPRLALAVSRHHIVPDTGPEAEVEATAAYPALAEVDVLLVSGSRYDAHSDAAWVVRLVSYVRAALDGGRVRVVGVCFGHQIVARAAGGLIGRAAAGMEVGAIKVTLTAQGREAFGTSSLTLQQYHRDEVLQPPTSPAVQILAFTPACAIHALLLPGRYLTIQGHPEYDAAYVERLLRFRAAAGIISEQVLRDGLSRVHLPCDSAVFASAVLRFIAD